MKRTQTRLDHERRIEEAVAFLIENLDETIDPRELADRVCLSRFHFHRTFQALLGETVGEMSRRLRLERAAHALRTSERSVTEIAFEASYGTLEAFIRAFRGAFGYSPSAFRKDLSYRGHLPTPNGRHFDDPEGLPLRFISRFGEPLMKIEIREAAARRAVCMAHTGPYYMIGQKFGALSGWMGEKGVAPGQAIALYHDDPATTPADQLRSHAGFVVADDFTTDDPRVEVIDIPGGRAAVGTHVGPYDGLTASWDEIYAKWFPASGYEFGEAPPYELYLNTCPDTPPDQLLTELWISIKSPL